MTVQVVLSPVVGGVTILLQEVILDEFGNFQSNFISFSKRSLWRKQKDQQGLDFLVRLTSLAS